MKYLSSLFVILIVVLASCSKDDDPTLPETQYKISFIHSDETSQTFDYDSEGNLKKWQYLETQSSQIIADATYIYDTEVNSVKIDAEESHGDQMWKFEEILYLNIDGTAKSAEGIAELYQVEDKSLLMRKRYSAVFNYNVTRQLESIRIVEKRIIENGDDPYPLKWNIDFVWSNGNLIESKEYSNPTSPLKAREYSYYDGVGADYAPIVQYPFLRAYYTPLRYQGYFGVQTKGLVKKCTVDNTTTDYSYNLSTNSTNSIVEGYLEKLPSGREIQYTIGWE